MPKRPLVLLAALALSGNALPAEEADEAQDLLARAEEAAGRGRYAKADALYRKIVETVPGTELADLAEERLAPNAWLRTVDLEINGDPANRIDVFILGDGYTREPKFQKLFDRGAQDTLRYFDQAPVFRRYRKFFNFVAMNIASHEDGVDARGEDFDTALGAHESGASQGQVAVNHRDVARWLRLDPRAEGYAVCLVRLGTLGTGGGGVAVVGGVPSNTVIHEWGHAFANLLDEYTSDVGYTGPAPRGINVSNTDDPDLAPWKHWLDAREKGVGMFPGAAGRSQGAWRATASGCAMNSGPSYCLVCREAVVATIWDQVHPIDEATPHEDPLFVEPDAPVVVELRPMEVVGSPSLKVEFTLEEVQGSFEAAGAVDDALGSFLGGGGGGGAWDSFAGGDPSGGGAGGGIDYGGWVSWNRPSRAGKPEDPPPLGRTVRFERSRDDQRRTVYRVTLESRGLEPGNHLLHARVVDPTDWVIKPEWVPLLSETRTWKIVVR